MSRVLRVEPGPAALLPSGAWRGLRACLTLNMAGGVLPGTPLQ